MLCLLLRMHGLAALLFPLVLMGFALAMETGEQLIVRRRDGATEVEEFLAAHAEEEPSPA